MLKTVSKVDNSNHAALAFQQSEGKLNPKCITKEDWVEAQSKDKIISEIINLFKSKKLYCCKFIEIDKNEMKQFIRQCNRLFMRNGIPYHKSEVNHPDISTMQLVLPETFRKQALEGCHNDLGHIRIEQMIDLLRDHFYWPGMLNDTTKHIKNYVKDVQNLWHYLKKHL